MTYTQLNAALTQLLHRLHIVVSVVVLGLDREGHLREGRGARARRVDRIVVAAVRVRVVARGAGAVRALPHQLAQPVAAVLALDVAARADPAAGAVGHGEGGVVVREGGMLIRDEGLWGHLQTQDEQDGALEVGDGVRHVSLLVVLPVVQQHLCSRRT